MFKKSLLFLFALSISFSFTENLQAQRKRSTIRRPKIITTVTVKAEPEPEVSTKNLNEAQKLRLESFRTVWQTINEHYFDQTFNGLNWQKLKYETELKVVKLETDAQLYDLLNELVGRLDHSHFAIIPPEFLREIHKIKTESESNEKEKDTGKSQFEENGKDEDSGEEDTDEVLKFFEEFNSRYGIGVEVRIFGREVVISRIDKDSAAEKAGLKIGYKIEKINGVALLDFIAKLQAIKNYETKLKKQVPTYIQTLLLNGEKDSIVSVIYHDGREESKEIKIKREKLEGELNELMANLPRQFLQFETRNLNEETGYIRFNLFTVSTVEKFCAAITEFKNKKSLIIDMRGNFGGSFGSLFGIAGLLTDKEIIIGTEISDSREQTHIIKPHVKNFKGKIVVLVDNLSLSAAEILSAALQESGRATVVGETSGGEALPSISKLLPIGAVFQYPVSNFKTSKGKILEGKGVTPDLNIVLDKTQLLAGKDNQIEAAIELLKKNEMPTAKAEEKKSAQIGTKTPPRAISVLKESKGVIIKEQYDAVAVSIVEKYINAIGGAAALANLKTVLAEGTAEVARIGAVVSGDLRLIRKSPGKYSETYNFTGVGDVSEIFDGEQYFVQTQVNGVQEFDLPAKVAELKLENNFLELVNLKSTYKQVKYLGNFERLGERVNLIEVKNAEGRGFALAFDAKTNLLVNRTGTLTDISYNDYRKVGEYMFPFKITKAGLVNIEFSEIETNIEVKDEAFSRKTSCFDKVD